MPQGLVQKLKLAFALLLFVLATLLSLVVRVSCLGGGMHFCRSIIFRPLVRLALRLHRIRIEVPETLHRDQLVFYLFNHHSNLDIAIIAALELSKLRTFFSTENKLHFPVMLASKSMGAFLLPPQHRHSQRVKCFVEAEHQLRHRGESMIASPEGTRFVEGGMAPFNKGVFHLALRLGYPIVPLYFEIPNEDNPKLSLSIRPTVVTVRVLETVETRELPETAVNDLRDRVRKIYVEHNEIFKRKSEARVAPKTETLNR